MSGNEATVSYLRDLADRFRRIGRFYETSQNIDSTFLTVWDRADEPVAVSAFDLFAAADVISDAVSRLQRVAPTDDAV